MKGQKEIFQSVFVLAIFISGFGGISLAQTAGFQGLGDFPGGLFESGANAISGDGLMVVGQGCPVPLGAHYVDYEAFRCTPGSDLEGLGHIPPGPGGIFPYQRNSIATSISYDGSTIVGWCFVDRSGWTGFRWDETNPMQPLNWFTPLDGFSVPTEDKGRLKISDDGNTIVGKMVSGNGWEAFRWTQTNPQTQEGILIGLGEFESIPFGPHSAANDVSADGAVVVGTAAYAGVGMPGSATYYYQAFRWTDANLNNQADLGEMKKLGFLGESVPPNFLQSEATAVSPDGTIVVGWSHSDTGIQAFRWILTDPDMGDGEMIGLGILEDYIQSIALDVSADGSIVVGTSPTISGPIWNPPSEDAAFLWDELHGIRDLKEVLETDYGLNLTGWVLTSANSISADGYVIVGSGINPDGDPEGWMATIPEPASISLLSLAGLVFVHRRKGKIFANSIL